MYIIYIRHDCDFLNGMYLELIVKNELNELFLFDLKCQIQHLLNFIYI